jgi:hypothetical protein
LASGNLDHSIAGYDKVVDVADFRRAPAKAPDRQEIRDALKRLSAGP